MMHVDTSLDWRAVLEHHRYEGMTGRAVVPGRGEALHADCLGHDRVTSRCVYARH